MGERVKVAWVLALMCAVGCGPVEDLAISDEVGAPDAGAPADVGEDAKDEDTGGGFEGCGGVATCANHDAERLELSLEERTLTVALEGLPYTVDALTFRGNRVIYVCGVCSAGYPECEEQYACEALDATPFTLVAAPVDSAFTFAFPDDEPLFDGVEWLALEWEDPCGVTQALAFEGEWDDARDLVHVPLGCVE